MTLESQYMIENVLRQAWFMQAAMPLYWFGGALVAILILWLMLYVVDQLKLVREHRVEPSQSLFTQLCEAHVLTKTESIELRSVADLVSHATPAAIFVRPDLLAEGCQKLGLDEVRHREWQHRLFGEAIAAEVELLHSPVREKITSSS